MIRNDNGDLAGYIYVYLDNITAPEYVDRARVHLQEQLSCRRATSLEWTGLYQYAEEARSTLRIVVPITLVIMFGLLVMAFRSVADSSLIMLSAPFALVGGVLLQWYQGYSMTTAVIIGYVSLFAVAIQTGIIMIEFIREALASRPAGQSYMEAVVEGSVARLRPKLMTVATTVLGLLPIMLSSGSGMDITQANRHAHLRRDDQLDDLRALPDPMPLRNRRRRPPPLAAAVCRCAGAGAWRARPVCGGRLRDGMRPGRQYARDRIERAGLGNRRGGIGFQWIGDDQLRQLTQPAGGR